MNRTSVYASTKTSGPDQPPGRSSYASGIVRATTNIAIIATLMPLCSTPWSAGA